MFEYVGKIGFSEDTLAESIPVYLCVFAMPLLYSISEGIFLRVISYVVLQAATGRAGMVTPLMYVLAVL